MAAVGRGRRSRLRRRPDPANPARPRAMPEISPGGAANGEPGAGCPLNALPKPHRVFQQPPEKQRRGTTRPDQTAGGCPRRYHPFTAHCGSGLPTRPGRVMRAAGNLYGTGDFIDLRDDTVRCGFVRRKTGKSGGARAAGQPANSIDWDALPGSGQPYGEWGNLALPQPLQSGALGQHPSRELLLGVVSGDGAAVGGGGENGNVGQLDFRCRTLGLRTRAW